MVGLGVRGRNADQRVEEAFALLVQALQDLAEADPRYAELVIQNIDKELGARWRHLGDSSTNIGFASDPVPSDLGRVSGRSDSRGGEDTSSIEAAILALLQRAPDGLTVEDLVRRLEASDFDVKRPSLIVRLRRMALSGKIDTKTRGQYVLAAGHVQETSSSSPNEPGGTADRSSGGSGPDRVLLGAPR